MSHYFVFRSERGFKNVIARDCHCLAYTSDSIYVWGTNYGQFGFSATETKVIQPKKVRIPSLIIGNCPTLNIVHFIFFTCILDGYIFESNIICGLEQYSYCLHDYLGIDTFIYQI